jgi:hypothetical protein
MDVHIVIGWNDMRAYDCLVALKIVPESKGFSEEIEYDPHEFCVSNHGIYHIRNELSMINQRFGTKLDWRMYSGDTFILVWRDELYQAVGDPTDEPVNLYYIDHHYKGAGWDSLNKHFELPSNPMPIMIIDAEIFYHNYIANNNE